MPLGEMATRRPLAVEDVLRVNSSRRAGRRLPLRLSLADALLTARRIWLDEVDVSGWLEAFAAHPPIGTTSPSVSKCSKEEQSAALSTATDSTAQWRYANRPIVELEVAAQEELKITELHLAKLFSSEATAPPFQQKVPLANWINRQLLKLQVAPTELALPSQPMCRTSLVDHQHLGLKFTWRCGRMLQVLRHSTTKISMDGQLLGSSVTNNDGRSGQLMDITSSTMSLRVSTAQVSTPPSMHHQGSSLM